VHLDFETIKNSSNLELIEFFNAREYNETLKQNVKLMKKKVNAFIFPKIKRHITELIQHKFANYIIIEMIPFLSMKNLNYFYFNVSL